MKISTAVSLFALGCIFFSCKEKENNTKENNQITVEGKPSSTYAEISIKEGGSWDKQNRTYVDGTFKNVESLDLPAEHTDHSWYIRYEGPGWENKQIAYRLYLDWRNAIDIFGKKVDTLVLPQVGQEGFDSYHEPAPWGQDILKAGKSLGIGGYGRFTGDTIAHFRKVAQTNVEVSNEEAQSSVSINYSGWETGDVKTDLKSVISIFPEDRFMKVQLTPSTEFKGLATGIVKFNDIPLLQETSTSGDWAYIATYGTQTLVSDQDLLGMAIFYKTKQAEVTEGPFDHLLVFKPSTETQTYYLLGAWAQEPGGITDEQAFKKDVSSKLKSLNDKGALE